MIFLNKVKNKALAVVLARLAYMVYCLRYVAKKLVTRKCIVDEDVAISRKRISAIEEKPVSKKVKVGVEQVKADSSKWMSDLAPKKDIILNKKGVPVKYSHASTIFSLPGTLLNTRAVEPVATITGLPLNCSTESMASL